MQHGAAARGWGRVDVVSARLTCECPFTRSKITNQDPPLPEDVDLFPCVYLYIVNSISCYLCVYVSAAYIIPEYFDCFSLVFASMSMCVCRVECV